MQYNSSQSLLESEMIMAFSIDELEEMLDLKEIGFEQQIFDDDEFSDIYEDEMEEQFEEIMMTGPKKGSLEEVLVMANGHPSERRVIIVSGGMKFIYKAKPNLDFRLFLEKSQSLFTMDYYWNDMVKK